MFPWKALAPTSVRRLSPARIMAAMTISAAGFATSPEVQADPGLERDVPARSAREIPAVSSSQLAAFFKQYCVTCHGAEEPQAKVAVHDLAGQPRSAVELALWKTAAAGIHRPLAPPRDTLAFDQRRTVSVSRSHYTIRHCPADRFGPRGGWCRRQYRIRRARTPTRPRVRSRRPCRLPAGTEPGREALSTRCQGARRAD